MFSKLYALALLVPFVSAAITVDVPKNPTSGGDITITWNSDVGTDPPTFSFELINTIFNNAFAIANNVDSTAHSISLTLPIVPVGDGYTIEAVNIGNIGDVFGTSGSFSIGATTVSSSSQATSLSAASSARSSSSSGTKAASTTSGLAGTSSTSGFGVTQSNTASATAPSGSNSASDTTASQSSNAGVKASFGGVAQSLAVAAVGVVLGGAAVAF